MTTTRAQLARPRMWLGAAAWLAGVAGLASGVLAQAIGGRAGVLLAPVPRQFVQDLDRQLQLDEFQRDAMSAMYSSYRTGLKALATDRQREHDVIHRDDQKPWRERRKKINELVLKFSDDAEALRARLLEEAQMLLTEGQQARFEGVLRELRREHGLGFGIFSGETIDLVEVVRVQKIDRTGEIAEILDEYEREMDRILRERTAWIQEYQRQGLKTGWNDSTKDLMRRTVPRCRAVRDLNQSCLRRLEAVLPDDVRQKVSGQIRQQIYSNVYKGSAVIKALEHAGKIATLNPEQREQIALIDEGYAREADPINAAWARAIDRERERLGKYWQDGTWENNDEIEREIDAKRRARRSLDERYLERVLGALTGEQRDTMPKVEVEPIDREPPEQGFFNHERWNSWSKDEEK